MTYRTLAINSMLPMVSLCCHFETAGMAKHKSPRRVAKYYELGFYLDGDGTININGKDYPIKYGDIRFTCPGTHLYSLPHYSCYTIYFDFGESNVVYQNQLLDGIPEYFHTTGEYRKIFEELLLLFNSKDIVAPLKLNALLMSLLSQLFEHIYPHKKYSDVVASCISYMEENFSQNLTLETLGKHSGYSSLHFLRLFKRDTGCTPHDFLTSIRINNAKEMLIYTNEPLSEIASKCGFNSDSHFNVLFKKVTGLTPSSYRKSARMP